MKGIKIISVFLVLVLMVSLCSCSRKPFYKRKDIESVTFRLAYPDATIFEEDDITDPEVLDAVGKALKKLNFNRYKPWGNIWTLKRYDYVKPQYCHTIKVKTKEYGTIVYSIDQENKCYSMEGYRNYSKNGEKLVEVMEQYFAE